VAVAAVRVWHGGSYDARDCGSGQGAGVAAAMVRVLACGRHGEGAAAAAMVRVLIQPQRRWQCWHGRNGAMVKTAGQQVSDKAQSVLTKKRISKPT
jgi:hypothetical protein